MSGLVLTQRQRERLQRQLKEAKDSRVVRRTMAILEYDQGMPITHIATALGVDRRSIHRWLAAYLENHDPMVLWDEQRSGRPRRWTEEYAKRLDELMQSSPESLGYYAVNWTVPLLQEQLERETGQWFSDETIRRGLRQLHYAWKRPRYVLRPDPDREKKNDAFADKFAACHLGVSFWPRMRRKSCCSLPCGPPGDGWGSRRRSGCPDGTHAASSSAR